MRGDGGFGQHKTGDSRLLTNPRISENDFLKAIAQIRRVNISDLQHIDKEVIIAAMKSAYYMCDKKSQLLNSKIGRFANKNAIISTKYKKIFGDYIAHRKIEKPDLDPNAFFIQDSSGNKMSAKTLDRHYNTIKECIGSTYALSNKKKVWSDLRQSGACYYYESILNLGHNFQTACDWTASRLGLKHRAQVRDLLRDTVKEDGRLDQENNFSDPIYAFNEKIMDVVRGNWNKHKKNIQEMHQKFIDEVDTSNDPEVKGKAETLKQMMRDSLKKKGLID